MVASLPDHLERLIVGVPKDSEPSGHRPSG
jgi:hypothetical protein